MPAVRRDVWSLPVSDKTLEWYGKAVEVLQSRSFDDPTSWWSLAAMHGIDVGLWTDFGFITEATVLPAEGSDTEQFLWKQCQHLTWYFLPWHRGYLAAFEKIIRAAVVELGGPESWALPYWNYSDSAAARELPPAFANPTLPSGGKNYLHVPRRYGNARVPNVQTPLVVDGRVAAVATSLAEPMFQGTSDGGSGGFGGIETPFWHGDETNDGTVGVLERQPHGGIHVMVGGGFTAEGISTDPHDWGLMTNPDTAALDPIFWLHHANIDRLWNVWLRQQRQPTQPVEAFRNPASADWLDGPHDRRFLMPRVDGSLFTFVARDMLDTTSAELDYSYDDDVVAPPVVERLARRFERLGATPEAAAALEGRTVMTTDGKAELLGASGLAVVLDSDLVQARVRLDSAPLLRLASSLDTSRRSVAASEAAPDRVYLNLEDIKSPSDAAVFYVYVNLPAGAHPEAFPEQLAGTVSMFGVSRRGAQQTRTVASNGVNATFEITQIIDKMHADNTLGDEISVTLVPAVPGATSKDIAIGRISVYRKQG